MRRWLQSHPGRRQSERWLSELCTQRRRACGFFGLSLVTSSNFNLRSLSRTVFVLAAGTSLANVAIWLVANAVGGMTIGVGEVCLGSVIGVVGAACVFVGLALRASRRGTTAEVDRVFFRVAVGVLVLYAFGPISAAFAPYREGAEKFNLTTVVATELMHLVSGLWTIKKLKFASVAPVPGL